MKTLKEMGAKDIGAFATTVIVFGLLVWSLVYVFMYVDTVAQVGEDGKVVLDKFGNAKSILLAILPLATTAVGYWLGNKGAGEAKEQAKDAKEQATDAAAQREAVIATASARLPEGTDILTEAKRAHWKSFGLDGPPA